MMKKLKHQIENVEIMIKICSQSVDKYAYTNYPLLGRYTERVGSSLGQVKVNFDYRVRTKGGRVLLMQRSTDHFGKIM